MVTESRNPEHKPTVVYQITVQGVLNEEWSDWFNGMTISCESESPPITRLTGSVIDQAKLRGIVNRIWDLNLIVISVMRIPNEIQKECRHE